MVDLPFSYVYAYPQNSNPGAGVQVTNPVINAGQSFPPGMANPIGTSLLVKGDLYCSPNCLEEFKNQAIRDSFGIQSKVILKALAGADQFQAEGNDLRTSYNAIGNIISQHPQIHENIVRYPTDNRSFSGGVLTPLHALAHAMSGGGAAVSFPISNVGLNVDLRAIPSVMNAVDQAPKYATSPIDVSFAYDVGKDSTSAWLTLGNITLRFVGSVDKYASGGWVLNGEIRAFNDVYDANPSTHRSQLGESLTSLLGAIPLTPYQIIINGSIPVQLTGM